MKLVTTSWTDGTIQLTILFLERAGKHTTKTSKKDVQTGNGDSTICPRSSDPFYIAIYCIKRITTSWIYSI